MSKPSVKTFQQVWRHMDREHRLAAAEVLCTAAEYAKERQHAAAVLASRMHLRPRSAAKISPEKMAGYLTSLESLDEMLAATLVRAYLFSRQQPMLSAFLDELQIPHKNGAISEDHVTPPSAEALQAAIAKLRASYNEQEVQLYVAALVASDSETWVNLQAESSSSSQKQA